MTLPDPLRDLALFVRSRYTLILLETEEEDRAAALLRELSGQAGLPLFTWTLSKGMQREGGALAPLPAAGAERSAPAVDPYVSSGQGYIPLDAFRRQDEPERTPYDTTHPVQALHHVELARIPALYHFRGLGAHLGDPLVAAKLRDAAASLEGMAGAVVLTGTAIELPEPLRALSAAVRLPLPRPAEYRAVLRQTLEELMARGAVKVEITPQETTRLLNALRGMGLAEARRGLTRVILEDGMLSARDVPRILQAKAEGLRRDGVLEYVVVEETLEGVAGLEGLKRWLAQRRSLLAEPERAREFGLPFPRGILLLGVPGCGKSLCAKAVAAEWGLPLLRFDPASLYEKYLGESEKSLRRGLRAAERIAPAVLWIDEIEKAFAAGGDDVDGGVSTRVLGSFLSWMQERAGDVFVVATANDVSRLPPELLRKGRFDEVFFVDLPGPEARAQILEIHLRRRNLDPAAFDVPALAAATEGFSGAELEQCTVSALYTALASNTRPTSALLREEAARTRPLSRVRAEEITRLREWARERTVSAG